MRARTATADRRFDPFGRRQKGDAAAPDSERMIRRRLSFPNRVSLFMFFFCVAFLFVCFFLHVFPSTVYGRFLSLSALAEVARHRLVLHDKVTQ